MITPTLKTFRQQVEPLIAELYASANTHDTDLHLAIYARDPALIVIIDGEVIRGWDAYRERQRQWWDDGRATGSYRNVGEPTYEALDGNVGLTTLVMEAEGFSPTAGCARATWSSSHYGGSCRRDGRITYAHESSTGATRLDQAEDTAKGPS